MLQIDRHCTVPQLAELDWTALHCIVAVGLYWLGLFRMEIHCNVLAWMRLDLSRWDWTGVRCLIPYLFTKWSGVSYEVLKKKKKKSNKTGCNQNMPALSLFRWSVELTDITFFSSCSIQRIRVFLFANQPNFTQVSIITLQYFFTYLLTDVHLLKTALSWAPKIFKCFKLPHPFLILFVLLETTLTTIL